MLKAPRVSRGYIAIPVYGGAGFSDPVVNLEHIYALALGWEMPEGINAGRNPRLVWSGSRIYKDMASAMMNEGVPVNGIFHLGCLGMTITTTSAEIVSHNGVKWIVVNNKGKYCGSINGKHVYQGALSHKERFEEMLKDGIEPQLYIPLHVMCGDFCRSKSGMLYVSKSKNRGNQISELSLMNSDGVFNSIKGALRDGDILRYFGFMANETKVHKEKVYTGGQCLRILEAMDIERYPIDEPSKQPNGAFNAQYSLTRTFWNEPSRYDNSIHLLPDFWELMESIRAEGFHKLDDPRQAEDYGFVESRRYKKPYDFPIITQQSRDRLTWGASGAILSSFRHFLAQDKEGRYLWAPNFKYVKSVWDRFGGDLVAIVRDHIGEKKASDRAKYRALWHTLFLKMENIRLQQVLSGGRHKRK